ncbi:MAG: 4-hydroxy-tetrahydrodipicolinate synthase [Deltaproteobacteria bacterium]|nr:4-hydroxy-tetrahydrodipicolinate synthase [Deltaproteobacteria bacterium]
MTTLFQGSMVALITPFKEGKLDEVALKKLIDFQIENGTSVLVPCGTTGESATLSHEEHDRVIALTVEYSHKRAKVLAGTGSNSTSEAIRLTQNARKAGADGALLICPYYNKPTQEGLLQHFGAIADAVDIPQVLYNIPGRTGINLLPSTIAKLAERKNIVGIKEATGNLIQASEVIAACPKDFGVYSGEDALTWPLYAIGAQGAISVTANILPKQCAELWNEAQKGNMKRARELHYQLLEINDVMFVETNPSPVKTALALMGFCGEEIRLPLVTLKKENKEKLSAILKKNKLI